MNKVLLAASVLLAGTSALAASTQYETAKDTGVSIVNAVAPAPTPKPSPTATPAPKAPGISLYDGVDNSKLTPFQGQHPTFPTPGGIYKHLVPSWGSGSIAPSAGVDPVGAFRMICLPGQLLRDDPILFQFQKGRSHLHQFFGNTKANADSTYGSLRTSGESTCNNLLNRSAYWIPAMLNGKGGVVRPDYVSIYYKQNPQSDPECQRVAKACVPLQRGMRYIFGYNMATGIDDGRFYFDCNGPTAKPGHYPDIVTAAKNCPVGNQLGAIITGPNCWDGRNVSSGDGRKHVSFTSYGSWGYPKCPSTHPYAIPTFTLGAWYTVDEDLDKSGAWAPGMKTWSLSSDVMPGMPVMRPGSTFHADWIGAWDDDIMKMWFGNCINKHLSCTGGDLGNGWQLKQEWPFSWTAAPRVVPEPAA